MKSFDERVKQAAQLLQADTTQLGDCDLLRIVIKDLTPLSDDERRAALDDFDFDAYTRRFIWESLHSELRTTPSWQWAGESASNVRALDKARKRGKGSNPVAMPRQS